MDNPTQSMLIKDNEENDHTTKPQEISKFRRFLPQVMAALARNLITMNTGLFEGLPTLIIPSLLGLSNKLNPNETIRITPSQASWIASFASLSHPLGAISGWFLSDTIGRRKSLLIASIPFIIGWSVLAFANSISAIYAAFLIMGIGLGLKEASSLIYTGEVCETSIRGILLASAGIFTSMGFFLVYSMGTFLSWRKISMICVSVPICIFVAVFNIPETPIWLLSKNQQKKALKSLKWLRGCVKSETVNDEYQQLQKYSIMSTACVKCAKQSNTSIKCEHKESFNDKLKQITRRRIVKPFVLITTLQFFLQFCAINSWRPYIIQILNAYTVRWDPNMTTVVLGSLGFAGRFCLLPTIKTLGKRKVYLLSSVITSLCCFGLSAIGFTFFPSDWSSFQIASNNISSINLTVVQKSVGNYSYLALALILTMQFAVNIGISIVPFMMISEVFPFKLKSMLCSITTADRYIFIAISSKIYYNIEIWLTLPGAAAFYGLISLTGFIVTYLILPETEGCSLEEIELHFSDNSRSFTDINIKRNQDTISKEKDCDISSSLTEN